MPSGLHDRVGAALGAEVVSVRPVGGGCISDAQRVELDDGRVVFVKSGAGHPSELLQVEAEGLRWLADAEALPVPAVLGLIAPRSDSEASLLVLEWIDSGPVSSNTGEMLGRGLAQLHVAGAPAFGWHRDGFIGSLPQCNTPGDDDWPAFWFSHRIEPLARRAIERGCVSAQASSLVTRFGERLPKIAGPPEPPARVHGDLWSGNVMFDREGTPWLIDPAAYGGHREADLAMLHLFGAPPAGTVESYGEVAPLSDGWRDRLSLWQLEPLLVHAVLFGGSYGAEVESRLRRFS